MDIANALGSAPPYSVRAWVLEKNGDVVGIAGYWLAGGRAVVFSDLMQSGMPKVTIWRAAREFMKKLKIPSLCVAQEGSGPFLERLGWDYLGDSPDGEVYQWEL